MIKTFPKNLVLTAGIAVIIMLVSGCQEETISDTNSSGARTRLLATENRELKKQINNLKKQHKNEIKQWDHLKLFKIMLVSLYDLLPFQVAFQNIENGCV